MGEEFGIYYDGMGDLCVCNQSGELVGKRDWYTTNIEMNGYYTTGNYISGHTNN